MKKLKAFVKRKYLMQMISYTMILMVLSVIAISSVFNIEVERQIVNNQNIDNRKIINLIDSNIKYMDEMIYQLGLSLYSDQDIYTLMYTNNVPSDIWDKIVKLQKSTAANSILDSIVIYNGTAKAFILKNALIKDFSDPRVKLYNSLLNQPEKIVKMQLIPVREVDENSKVTCFSSFLYESVGSYKTGDSILILNVKPEWLFNSIKAINSVAGTENNRIFILDSNNQIILGDDAEGVDLKKIVATTGEPDLQGTEKWKSSIYGKANEKLIVHLSEFKATKWKIMIVQSYKSVFSSLYKVRFSFGIIMIVFLLLSLILAYLISIKLYRPVENMVKRIRPIDYNIDFNAADKDEFKYISMMYDQALDNLDTVRLNEKSRKEIVRNYYLKKLIIDSSSISQQEYEGMVKENELKIGTGFPIMLCIAKIDDYKKYSELTNPSDKALFKFAITNITEEIVSSHYPCVMIDISGDQLVLLVNAGRVESETYKELEVLFRQVQKAVLEYYKISLSVAISEQIYNYYDITLHYNHCMQYILYKFVFGRKSVILPDMVQRNMNNIDWKIPEEIQKKIIDTIKLGDLANLEENIKKVFSAIAVCHYDCIMQTVLQLSLLIKKALNEMNDYRLHPILIDLSVLNQKLMEMETLEEMCAYFINLCNEVSGQQKNQSEDRSDILVDTIRQLIESNYHDPNFSLTQISGMLKMSQVYVGRVFKKSDSLSIGEYINEIRLGRALELLCNTEYTIKEIMEKVGYVNESYFWRLFKKKYGVTPKEYRMKMALK